MAAIILALVVAFPHAASAAPPTPTPSEAAEMSVGLLLVAVDVRRDFLRVSEALRISNPGLPVRADLRFTLPQGAQYLTLHRGLDEAVRTVDGFAVRPVAGRGLTEIVYSYALPTATRTSFIRAYPLPVQRMEVVVRGSPRARPIRLRATRGRSISPLLVAGESMSRWAVPRLPAGTAVTVTLEGLPVSVPWLPAAGALLLAAGLGTALVLHLRRPPRGGGGEPTGLQKP